MSPTFSSGKLKGMLEPMAEVAVDMMNFIEEQITASSDGEIDMKRVFQGLSIGNHFNDL